MTSDVVLAWTRNCLVGNREREREKFKHKVIVALGWWDGTCSVYISSHSIVSIKGKGEKMF